jgi:hypothetical protein
MPLARGNSSEHHVDYEFGELVHKSWGRERFDMVSLGLYVSQLQ